MKTTLKTLVATSVLSIPATGANLALYTFGTTVGNQTLGATTEPGVAASSIGRSALVDGSGQFFNSGISNPANERAVYFTDNAGDTNAGSVTYFTFTITPQSGNTINLQNLSFDYQFGDPGGHVGQSGNFSLRSSINGFTAEDEIGIASTTSGSAAYFSSPAFDLSAPEYQNLTTATEFRIYLSDNAPTNTRPFRLDNILLTGTVVPEPSTLLLSSLAALSLLRRRR